MYQIDNSTAVPVIPASTASGTAGFFTDGNPATGVPATIMPAEYQNMLMMEIINVLAAVGITPSKSTFTQLLTAIRAVNRQATILTDTGAANAYAAANTPALSALPATGYMQRVNIAHANTGASTYAPDGLTVKPIYGLGLQALQGGELPIGVAVLMYLVQAGVNSGNGAWIIIESLGGASQVAPATQSQQAVNLGQLASGASLTTPALFDNSTKMPTTAFVQRAAGNFSFSQQLSASTTLTSAYAGQHIWLAGSTSYTITLPVAGTVANGSALWLWSSNSATVTINVAGTDNMLVNSTSIATITLSEGDTLFLIANTSVGWIAIGGSRQLGYSNVFLRSSGVNGYQRLPGGLLECRGTFTASATAGAASAVTFPLAFSTLYSLVITPSSASTSIVSAWHDSATTTGFNGHCNLASTVCHYIAKGAS